jgi:hypothetical protein
MTYYAGSNPAHFTNNLKHNNTMTKQGLEKAINLQGKIKATEQLLQNINKTDCVNSIDFVFMFGNGNVFENKSVCYNNSLIEKVRELLIIETKLILENLKDEFKNL